MSVSHSRVLTLRRRGILVPGVYRQVIDVENSRESGEGRCWELVVVLM